MRLHLAGVLLLADVPGLVLARVPAMAVDAGLLRRTLVVAGAAD